MFVAWFAFGLITIELSAQPRRRACRPAQLLAYVLGLGLLAIALRMVWRPVADRRHAGRLRQDPGRCAIWLLWVVGCEAADVDPDRDRPALPVADPCGRTAPSSTCSVRGGDAAPLAEAALPAGAILLDRGPALPAHRAGHRPAGLGLGPRRRRAGGPGVAGRPAGPGRPARRRHPPGRRSALEARPHRDRPAARPVRPRRASRPPPTCLAGRGAPPRAAAHAPADPAHRAVRGARRRPRS